VQLERRIAERLAEDCEPYPPGFFKQIRHIEVSACSFSNFPNQSENDGSQETASPTSKSSPSPPRSAGALHDSTFVFYTRYFTACARHYSDPGRSLMSPGFVD
jgi:hypothetical protein